MVWIAATVLAVAAYLLGRWLLRHDPRTAAAQCFSSAGERAEWLIALVIVVGSQLPLLLASMPRVLVADASGHAAVAAWIASHGAPRGWIELFNGGFPLGPHYPPLSWLLAATLIRLGVAPDAAVHLLAAAATVAVPLLVLAGSRGLGARPSAAVAGALVTGCFSPMTRFMGGSTGFLELGLFAQSLAVPLTAGWFYALTSKRGHWIAPALAAMSVATHPQLAAPAFLLGAVALLLSRGARAIERLARSATAAVATAAALFVPGINTMRVPFGWPPMAQWKLIGLAPGETIRALTDGLMLDADRWPVVTVAWAVSLVVAALRWRSPPCRAVLGASIAAVLCTMSGALLAALPSAGEAVLTVFQPLRAMALIPLVAAAAVVVAVEELAAWCTAWWASCRADSGVQHLLPWAAWAVVAMAAAPAVMDTAAYGASAQTTLGSWRDRDWCDTVKPTGYSSELIATWLTSLARARFTVARDDALECCPQALGVELASPVPMGRPIGPGAHVGVNHVAFRQLRAGQPAAAGRAESLGIRTVLHTTRRPLLPADRWRVTAQSGEVQLSERLGGTDIIGVGCVVKELRGRNGELHRALMAELDHPQSTLLDEPQRLVRLRWAGGPLAVADVPLAGCDPTGAVVREREGEPGVYEGQVSLPAPADVVVRATAFRTWTMRVDDVVVPTFAVAPGFFASRLAAGAHHVRVEVGPIPGYGAGLLLCCSIAVCCCLPVRRIAARIKARRQPTATDPPATNRRRWRVR